MTAADKPRFAEAFTRLAIALREKDSDATTMSVYFENLQSFEIEFVVAAAERLERASWFPKVGEWGRAANAVERERRAAQQAFLSKLPTPLCPVCDDTGWARVECRVRRCQCQELRRLELLGRRPWPQLTLPEGPSESGPLTRDEARGAYAQLGEHEPNLPPIRTMPSPKSELMTTRQRCAVVIAIEQLREIRALKRATKSDRPCEDDRAGEESGSQ